MTIKVIGIGLEGANSLLPSVLFFIEEATVLVGGDRHLAYFPQHQGIKLKINNINHAITEIKKYWQQGEKIVILATGDPLFFGIGRILVNEFPTQQLEFYPHLSSVQLAFNRLQIPWQSAKVISLHGRDMETLINSWKKGESILAILTDKINNPLTIWQVYQQLKLPINYDFYLCENLGEQQEKITIIKSADDLNLDSISSLNLMILKQNNLSLNKLIKLDKLPLIGIEDNLFYTFVDRPGLITKREMRLLILGELELQNQQIIWDIGSGTGSVAIEMGRLCPDSQIYAIEKTAMGANLIQQNCLRFQVNNINIINNSAENIIEQLPSVDRVFIGGSSGNLVKILDLIALKIKPQGKVVIALATLENLYTASQWLQSKKWEYQIINAQINKSLAIANMTRFNPLNPVNIISAKCPLLC
jgi:precorrin-6Y C5,15-methyltransferase (decarboxylating)